MNDILSDISTTNVLLCAIVVLLAVLVAGNLRRE